MITRILIIGIMVLIIFFALSEHETWLDRMLQPQIDEVKVTVSDARQKLENYLAVKKEIYSAKINDKISRIQDRMDEFKISLKDVPPDPSEQKKSESKSLPEKHL